MSTTTYQAVTSVSDRTRTKSVAAIDGAQAGIKVSVSGLNFYYGENQALYDNNLDVAEGKVTAIIGP